MFEVGNAELSRSLNYESQYTAQPHKCHRQIGKIGDVVEEAHVTSNCRYARLRERVSIELNNTKKKMHLREMRIEMELLHEQSSQSA